MKDEIPAIVLVGIPRVKSEAAREMVNTTKLRTDVSTMSEGESVTTGIAGGLTWI